MENYFWFAVQNHFFSVNELRNGHRSHGDRGWNIDVLALVGPNRREVKMGEKKETCLVKSIMARAFEIALLEERQTSMTPLKGYWLDTAKTLIGVVPEPTCVIRPCPIQEIRDAPESDFGLSHRIQVDVSDCDSGDVDFLSWALADLEGPLTALGRAWGSEKYALFGAPDCITGETQPVPADIWASILSLLVGLGVKELRTRLERAAAFVWDLVECPLHNALEGATVIDLAEEGCRCLICDESRRGGTLRLPQEKTSEARIDSLPDESIHKACGEESTITDEPKEPHWFKLNIGATERFAYCPVQSLKLRTVKMLALLQTFRTNLGERLSRAGVSSTDLSQEILHREMNRTLSSLTIKSVATSLLEDNPLSISRDLVFRIRTYPSKSFTPLSKHQMKSLSGRVDWMRLESLRANLRDLNYSASADFRLSPCRVFTVAAVDNPLLYYDHCNFCPELSNTIFKYDSTLELSSTGLYAYAIWTKI